MIKKIVSIFFTLILIIKTSPLNSNFSKITLGGNSWSNIYLSNCQYKEIGDQKIIILEDNEYPFSPDTDLLIHFNHDDSKEWNPYIGNYSIIEKNFSFSRDNKVFGTSSSNFIHPKNQLILEPKENSIFTNNKFIKSFTIEFWLYLSSLHDNQYILQYLTPQFEESSLDFSEIKIKTFNQRLEWHFINMFEAINSIVYNKNKKKSFMIKSSKPLELEKWTHHAFVFNHITKQIHYYINGKLEVSSTYKNQLMRFNFNAKSILTIGKNLLGYLDEFSISKIPKVPYKKKIFWKKFNQSSSIETNMLHTNPYVKEKGFVISKVYDLKSPYSFLNHFHASSKNFKATNIIYQYRIKNTLFKFNELEKILPWKFFSPQNFKNQNINGRYFQWRAILNSDKNGKFTPQLKEILFEFLTDKIPSKPYNLKASISADHSIILTWDSPLESDIKAYHIYYGLESENYFLPNVPIKINVNDIPNELKPSYSIDFLEKGKNYYFSVTSIDSNNQESEFSNETYISLENSNQ